MRASDDEFEQYRNELNESYNKWLLHGLNIKQISNINFIGVIYLKIWDKYIQADDDIIYYFVKENRKCRSDVICSLAGVVCYTACQYIILQFAISNSFQEKIGRGLLAILSMPITLTGIFRFHGWMKIATPLLGIIKTSYMIIGLLQTPNQNFENNIIMSLSTEYFKQ